MNLLVTGRGEGKTTRIIDWLCARTQAGAPTRVLVVLDLNRRNWILREFSARLRDAGIMAQRLHVDIAKRGVWRIVTIEELQRMGPLAGRGPLELGIDDMGDVLVALIRSPFRISRATITADPWPEPTSEAPE